MRLLLELNLNIWKKCNLIRSEKNFFGQKALLYIQIRCLKFPADYADAVIYWLEEVFLSSVAHKYASFFIVFIGEKKKTKAIDNELNPVWNEVSREAVKCESYRMWICSLGNNYSLESWVQPMVQPCRVHCVFVLKTLLLLSPQLQYVGDWNLLFLSFQVLEFDLKDSSLDASSFINVVVKDYETIGKDKYV